MDKSLIYQAIENPSLRAKISVEELERIQAEYPYFSTAHVLLAKLYQEKNDHRFADQLQQAAVYASDRTVFYDYIKKVDDLEVLEILEKAEELEELEKVEEMEALDLVEELEELEKVEEIESVEKVEEVENIEEVEEVEALDLVEELEKLEELTIEQHQPNEEAFEEDQEETSDEPSLESSVRKAVSAAFEEFKTQFKAEVKTDSKEEIEPDTSELEATTEEIKSVKAKDYDPLDRDILVEAIHSSIEMELDEEESEELETEEEHEQLEIEEDSKESEGEKSYAQLMMERAARIQSQSTDKENIEPKNKSVTEPEIQKEPRPTLPSAKMNVKSPQDLQKSLIDKFIREQPKITPGKASDYSHNQNLGKESYEEDFTVVTETMAKLFVAQGKIDKARKVYRQLIALYPEKSIYFAAQLKNLNQNKKI